MASLKEVKNRINSVRSTLKITSAMKLVSSAKLRKAQSAIESMLPYRRSLEDILRSVSSVCPSPADPGVEDLQQGKTAVVAFSSNSSLCGAFNASVIAKAMKTAAQYDDVEFVAVGRKMAEAARRAGYSQTADYTKLMANPSYEDAEALADSLCSKFASGEYSRVILVYNHFVSTSKQTVQVEQYLPAAAVSGEGDTGAAGDFILEPGASELIGNLLPQVRRIIIYSVMLDSAAAEHAARVIAMQTATDNGEALLSELTLEYNKGRQQKITTEILDLLGGTA